ncbi:MAG: OadG family protein [Oscillospiraceae bacterium]|nr:OadG family protein [Oscillospiraceae bacterium]
MEMQMEMSYVWAVVITGLVVVFLGLVLLIAFISIVGKIFSAIDKSKKNKTVESPSKDAGVASVDNGFSAVSDDTEVVAAIAAAIAMMGIADNTTYKIKSIKAANNTRPSRSAWAVAGLNESTSPF